MADAQTPFDQIAPEEPSLRTLTLSAAPTPVAPDLLSASPFPAIQSDENDESSLAPDSEPIGSSGGGWTIPILCVGIALIACCLLIPATEENRRLVYERERLKADLEQLSRQTDVNAEFLKLISDDPSLSERLAQRQMKMVRQGTSVLELKGDSASQDMSPYELTTLAPPLPVAPYQPHGGILAQLVANPRTQLFVMGAGMLLAAAGLVLGSSDK
jgi:hypothetical protein